MPIKTVSDISSIGSNRKVVAAAGTAVQLSTTSVPCKVVIIQSETNNTGGICFGGSNVDETEATRIGVYLTIGEISPPILCDDLMDVYIDANVNGDGVTFVYYT